MAFLFSRELWRRPLYQLWAIIYNEHMWSCGDIKICSRQKQIIYILLYYRVQVFRCSLNNLKALCPIQLIQEYKTVSSLRSESKSMSSMSSSTHFSNTSLNCIQLPQLQHFSQKSQHECFAQITTPYFITFSG